MSKHNFLQVEVVTSSFCTDSWLITFWLGWNSRDLAGWPKWTTQTAKLVFHHFLLIFCPPSPLCVLLSHGGGEEAIWTPSESCTETNHFLPAFVKCTEGQRSGSKKFHEEMLHRAGPLPLFSFYCVCWGSEGFMLSGLRWCNAAWTSQELDVGQDNKEGWTQSHIKGDMKLRVWAALSLTYVSVEGLNHDQEHGFNLPVHLCSDPHLWSWAVGSDSKNEIADTARVIFLRRVAGKAAALFHWKEPGDVVLASDLDASWAPT